MVHSWLCYGGKLFYIAQLYAKAEKISICYNFLVDDITSIVGNNLKDLRKSRHLTLECLSEITGVSISMLGEIERGMTNPTITILWKIADGLKIPFSELLAVEKESVEIIRRAEAGSVLNVDEVMIRAMFGFDPDKKFEVLLKTFEPGAVLKSAGHRNGVEEYLLICGGTLTLEVGDNQVNLAEGDAIRFDGTLAHTYRNQGNSQVNAFTILYYNPI